MANTSLIGQNDGSEASPHADDAGHVQIVEEEIGSRAAIDPHMEEPKTPCSMPRRPKQGEPEAMSGVFWVPICPMGQRTLLALRAVTRKNPGGV